MGYRLRISPPKAQVSILKWEEEVDFSWRPPGANSLSFRHPPALGGAEIPPRGFRGQLLFCMTAWRHLDTCFRSISLLDMVVYWISCLCFALVDLGLMLLPLRGGKWIGCASEELSLLWFLFPRDMKLDGGRQCHSAGVCLKEIIGLEGVELGADGKVGTLRFLLR